MPQNPLDLLRGELPGLRRPRLPLGAEPEMPSPNDPASLFGFQGALGDEAFGRSIQAERAGQPIEAGVLMKLFGKAKQDQVAGGIPAQQAQYDETMGDLTQASTEGFGLGPQSPEPHVNPLISRNVFKRKMEQEKMRQPMTVAELQQRGATQRQGMQADSASNVARINAEGNLAQEGVRQGPAHQFNELQRMIVQPQAGGAVNTSGPVRSLSRSSVGFQTPPNTTSQSNQFALATGALARAGGSRYLNYNDQSPEQQQWNAFATNIISKANLDPAGSQAVLEALQDPQKSQLPLEEIFEVEQLTPQEHALLTDLFTQIRGR